MALLRPGYTGDINRESSLIVVPITGGPVATVPQSAGLENPVWTPDGAALIASTGATSGLVRVDPSTGSRTPIAGTTGARVVAVSRTGRLAFALTQWQGSGEIRLTGLSGGTSTLVGVHVGASDLSWDPTGEWLAVTGAQYGEAPFTQLFDLRSGTPRLARTMPGGTSIAWLVPASAAPVAGITSPSWTSSTASLGIGATDPDDAPGGLRRECALDGGAWVSCPATWTVTGLGTGPHTAAARVTDPSGRVSETATRTWSADPLSPAVALAALPPAVTGTGLQLAWKSSDAGGSGVRSVDVRARSANFNGPFGALSYPSAWQGLTTTSLAMSLTAGREYCFSARVRDVAGNLSAWSAETCTAVALDDRSLAASAGWTRGTSSTYAYGTYTRATSSGRSLTRDAVSGRRIAVVVTTCSTCGVVDVYHAGVKLIVEAYSAKTACAAGPVAAAAVGDPHRHGADQDDVREAVVVEQIAIWH